MLRETERTKWLLIKRSIRASLTFLVGALGLGTVAVMAMRAPRTPVADDQKIVAALDTQYQEAVKNNDVGTMNHILADDFVLVTGSGKTYTKAQLLEEARSGRVHYQHQEDTEKTVRVWGDTAVVTAKLWEKGTESGKPLDYRLWFSDTYVRTTTGWRYVFGQASLPLANPDSR
jgi:ketosteroid isomerase-like protein